MQVVKGQLQDILLSKLHVEIVLLVQYHNRMAVY